MQLQVNHLIIEEEKHEKLGASSLGLTVSFPKTKFMVVGAVVSVDDHQPLAVGGGLIEWVDLFPYLGSVIEDKGSIDAEVDRRIANASRAFGALRQSVFDDCHLSIRTKRCVYQACVLSTLLYGSECWTPLRRHLKRLDSFHNRCIRAVLKISNKQQWEQHISSAVVRQRWGDMETIATKLRRRRLEWLGHVARMTVCRLPRICLFGWLAQVRPFHGPKRRWRDLVKSDLQSLEVSDGCWCALAQDRRRWRELCLQCLAVQQDCTQVKDVICALCGRSFRRECDKARHKCIAE